MKQSKKSPIRELKTPDGTKIKFLIEGDKRVLHSYEGPAIERVDGNNEYYIFGIKYSKDVWEEMRALDESENLDLD